MIKPSPSRRPPSPVAPDETHEDEQQALLDVHAAFRWLAATEDARDESTAGEVRRRRAAVDAAAARSHYTLAVLGRDIKQRIRLLNDLLGEPLLDPARQDAVGSVVRFRHGASMDYRARFLDGRVEDFSDLDPDRGEQLREDVARRRGGFEETQTSLAEVQARLEQRSQALQARRDEVVAAEAELERLHQRRAAAARAAQRAAADREQALTVAETHWSGIPRFVRAPPPWWAFWAWIARVLTARRYRGAITEAGTLSQRAVLMHSHQDAADQQASRVLDEVVAWQRHLETLRAAREEEDRRLSAVEEEERAHRSRVLASRDELHRAERAHAGFDGERRQRFRERVRRLTDARGNADQLESLQVELEALPPPVELIDIGGVHHALDLQQVWELLDRDADGCAVAGELPRQAQRLFGGAIRSATPEVLVDRLRRARVLRATRHASEACKAARQSLEAAGVRTAESARRRIDALHKAHEAGTRRLERELVRVQAAIAGRAMSALSQAGNHIEWAIDQLRAKWLEQVRGAETLAGLRATLASIENEADEAIAAAAADARGLLVSTLSGILAELVPALADESSEFPVVMPAAWSELEFSPFPSDLRRAIRVAPSRFGSHLQPLATTRAACAEALDARVESLRHRAVATLLHLEPKTAKHLENTLRETVQALQQGRNRRYQRAVAEIRGSARAGTQADRDDLQEELDAFASRLAEHERKLARGL